LGKNVIGSQRIFYFLGQLLVKEGSLFNDEFEKKLDIKYKIFYVANVCGNVCIDES
jgi:hypothetical protein